jgi:hypothetical protein
LFFRGGGKKIGFISSHDGGLVGYHHLLLNFLKNEGGMIKNIIFGLDLLKQPAICSQHL